MRQARSPTAITTTWRSGATTVRSSTCRTFSGDAPGGGSAVTKQPGRPDAERLMIRTFRTDEQLRNGINVIPPQARPRVVLRYVDSRDLLVSGLVENGSEIAQHAAVVY